MQLVRPSIAVVAGLATFLCMAGVSSGQSPQSEERSEHWSGFGPQHEHKTPPKLVGYLPDYDGSYADYAKSLDFSKMTHLYLAFGLPPFCTGTCTKSSDMTFALGQTDADIHTLVKAAHKAGTKVVLSIGGGGGDQQILQFYDAGLSKELVKSLNKYIKNHDLDGVDLDIEDPDHMGQPYLEFTRTLIETFHPQGKIVTAAVAEYLQDSMPDAALHLFDFVNVMNYSNYSDAEVAMTYYAETKKVPKEKMTLGVPFFAQSGDGNIEETFSTVVAAYPNAFDADMVSGGNLDGGETLYYVGGATMARETELGKQYGGVMIWELSQDAPAPSSLMQVIDEHFPAKEKCNW
ncbi:glycosyl hydrolase family 18 protein [Acidicapsa ligni]|uniref:glycosyl hydrolase family 18 protein n=1 Tax=Acidicapsa ligni TaxID=542300 RepID=UPI0021E039D8|nr:glycosyl hydrolase family 18 protein [Acidicapsa ligni]